jgi:hypothetical protein
MAGMTTQPTSIQQKSPRSQVAAFPGENITDFASFQVAFQDKAQQPRLMQFLQVILDKCAN